MRSVTVPLAPRWQLVRSNCARSFLEALRERVAGPRVESTLVPVLLSRKPDPPDRHGVADALEAPVAGERPVEVVGHRVVDLVRRHDAAAARERGQPRGE